MRNIIGLLLFVFALTSITAQSIVNEWKITQYYDIRQDSSPVKTIFYEQGQQGNAYDGMDYKYKFNNDGTYEAFHKDTLIESDTWILFSNGDSLLMQGYTADVETLDTNNLIVRSSFRKFGIDFYKYFHFVKFNPLLPVELFYFDGTASKNMATLKWGTATELNNDKFIIEYSTNGTTFNAIGEVPSKYNDSEVETNYQYVHRMLGPINYYRLKQIDLDGTSTLSNTIIIKQEGFSNSITNVLSTLVDRELVVQINAKQEGKMSLRLFDVASREYLQKEVQLAIGWQEFRLPVSNLVAGVYFLDLNFNGYRQAKKIVKQ